MLDSPPCATLHAAMRITFVLPGLLALPERQLSEDRGLARIAARSANPQPCADLDAAILASLALDAAPAPLAAVGAGMASIGAWTIRADPVSIVVGREDAHIDRPVHDLDDDERTALLALLNDHFASDGLVFAAPRADAWFATAATAFSIVTAPVERAAGRALREFLPAGRDAAHWRRWLTETQMLLHEHPLGNRSGAPVNSLWFHGGGALASRGAMPDVAIQACGGRAADVVRGIAKLRGEACDERTLDAWLQGERDAIVVLAPLATLDALADASQLLQRALDRLDAGALSSVELIASDAHRSARWQAHPQSWFARWKHRRTRFALPAWDR